MKSILNLEKVLILSLILWGCNPDCDMLQISDASEIQFWRTGEQTSFNLEEEGYTDEGYCFHQKFLCTSQRKFQGVDEDAIINDYWLVGFDEDGAVLYNEQYIVSGGSPGNESNIFTDEPLSGWTNSGTGTDWTLGANPNVTLSGSPSKALIPAADIYAPADQLITVNINGTTTGEVDCSLTVIFKKDGVVVDTQVGSIPSGFGLTAFAESLDFTLTEYCNEVEVIVEKLFFPPGSNPTITLTSIVTVTDANAATPIVYSLSLTPSDESMCNKKVQFKIYDGADPETDNELFHSDFIDFVSSWANAPGSGRVQIQYTNSKNFAGLYYDGSLSYFNIELEGRFRIERPVTAQKVLELSEVILNTATTVKMQRKLTIDDVPDYMHRKIALILAHAGSGSILINGKDWSVEEGYEKSTDVPESYPLAPANIWLTEKDYYKHNII